MSVQVCLVLVLLRTQSAQHRVRTKAPKLRRSEDNNTIYFVFVFPKTQATQHRVRTNALQLRGRGQLTPLYSFIVFLLPKAQPTQDRGCPEAAPRPDRHGGRMGEAVGSRCGVGLASAAS